MRTLKTLLAAACGSLALGGAAQAQDEGGVSFAFNLGANTDYVFRGISQTDEDPSVYGGIDASAGIGYAGVWVSNVDFGNGTDLEYDIYAGIKPTMGAVTFDLALIYYGYLDSPKGSNQDYVEAKVAASVPAGPATLGAAVFYSPEFFGKTGDAWYKEVNVAVAVPDTKFSMSAALGHQAIDVGPGYTTWNAGVGYQLTDNIGLDLRYHDTAKDKFGDISEGRVVAGLKLVW
jgi:uncharacterized protein (TIGR02001 family)